MKKQANISFVLLVALLTVLSSAALLGVCISGRYNTKTEYERLNNRYIAESGVDTAIGLFMNYLDNQDYVLAYTRLEDGSYIAQDQYAPYLFPEIADAADFGSVNIDFVSRESEDYLTSVGCLDFSGTGYIELCLELPDVKEKFRVTQVCTEPDFILSDGQEHDNSEKRSKINPLYLTVKAKYKNGEAMCNVKISDVYLVRQGFSETEPGVMNSVPAYADTGHAKIEYVNYQNYRRQ